MKHPRVLVVENDRSIREACTCLFEINGFTVETCENGLDALSSLKNQGEPCLILLDMKMPIMDGQEFMAELAKRPQPLTFPVYLMSATATKRDGLEMGCQGFIKKPFDIVTLLDIARGCCESN